MSGRNETNTSRRTVLKTLGALSVGAAVPATVRADDAAAVDKNGYEPPHTDARRVDVDDALRSLSPNWILLASPKSTVRQYLEDSSLADSRKTRLLDTLKDLWDQYPVTRETTGNVTRVALADDVASADASQLDALDEIALGVHEGAAAARPGDGITTQWNPGMHGKIAAVCADNMGVLSYYENEMQDAAGEPDSFDRQSPDWVSGDLETYVEEVVQSWRHYRNPDKGYGSAHTNAADRLSRAKDEYGSGNYTEAYTQLAYAGHYVTDCAVPLHTGMELEQASDYLVNGSDAIHFTYENWVASNWDSLKSALDDGSHYTIYDAQQGAEDLASTTKQDASTVYWTIFNNPDSWQSDLEDVTRNRLGAAGLYQKGFIDAVIN